METGSDPLSFPPFYLFANRKACSMLVENIYLLTMPQCIMVNKNILSQTYVALICNRWYCKPCTLQYKGSVILLHNALVLLNKKYLFFNWIWTWHNILLSLLLEEKRRLGASHITFYRSRGSRHRIILLITFNFFFFLNMFSTKHTSSPKK